MYGIWLMETGGWMRELPSKVDGGNIALLAFESKREACKRAAKEFGYETYTEMKRDGWCEVRTLNI
jgi:hypothetical protein